LRQSRIAGPLSLREVTKPLRRSCLLGSTQFVPCKLIAKSIEL
jgi:hypothetical protein